MNKMSVNLAPRDEAIQSSLAAWARFHLTLDRSIEGESDKEMREVFTTRQVFEFGKVLAFQKAAPLTYAHFRQALKHAGAEPHEETRFEGNYKVLKLEAIKARTLQSAHTYKQALRRARQRIHEAEQRLPSWKRGKLTVSFKSIGAAFLCAQNWFSRRRPILRPGNSFGILS